MRGPAKRKKGANGPVEKPARFLAAASSSQGTILCATSSASSGEAFTIPSWTEARGPQAAYHDAALGAVEILQPNSLAEESREKPEDRLPIVADFLLPGAFDRHLETLKSNAQETAGTRRFTPLLPAYISHRLIQNTFSEITAEHPVCDLDTFVALLDAQYAVDAASPADSPARWALVNSILARAMQAKTAPGSEVALSGIAHGFYQNATNVLPELLLQEPSLLSIQALLAMALCSRGANDVQGAAVFAANALRQLDLLAAKNGATAANERSQEYTIAHALSTTIPDA
ncbi:hypothetical protein GQ53DRAFT_345952 [Thozetella sp. PMI_491]|nr:hypothetical protein GQ53DRAFT_345952 [Thozetella sp. PMI_491]